MPSIEYYEVLNIKEFHRDLGLQPNFFVLGDPFKSEDELTEVYLSEFSEKKQSAFQGVRQKGQRIRESKGNELSNFDKFNTVSLLRSLAFPCVFMGILAEHTIKLNRLILL